MDDASAPPSPKRAPQTATDWARLAQLSEEKLARAVKSDPDAAPLLDDETLQREYQPHPARLPER